MVVESTAANPKGLQEVLAIVKDELKGEFPIEEFVSKGIPSILIRNTTESTRNFKIILNAHLDVVPGKEGDFTPKEKDGKLYGRGAYDMKAAAAVMVYLFKDLAKTVSYPIALQLVTDEEVGGFHGVSHQIDEGVRGEFVISGECGSNLRIIHKAKGIVWLKLHARGVTAHSAYLWRGSNALVKLHKALAILHELFPHPESAQWVTTMNLAKIETSNTTFNHVPDDARAFLDIRFTEGTKETMVEKIKNALPDDIDIEVLLGSAPHTVSPDNTQIMALTKAIEQVTQKKAQLGGSHAQSDLRHFTSVGCPGVEFGIAGEHQHGDEEWVNIKSLEDYYTILKTYLLTA